MAEQEGEIPIESEEEEDVEDVAVDEQGQGGTSQAVSMDPQKARLNRLFELRMKLNKARSLNKTAVLDEFKRQQEGPNPCDWKKKKEESRAKQTKSKQDLADESVNPEKEYLNISAAQSEAAQKKKRKAAEGAAPFGWEIFNTDTMYSSYKKRVKRLHTEHGGALAAAYVERKAKESPSEFFPDAESLVVSGAVTKTDENAAERVVEELATTTARRAKFSRRRQFWEEADIDYVNERNRVFNNKLRRSFDPYTIEIKQNLERGTAL
eukprot:RCo048507